jgi:hypothetical protein
MNKKKLMKILKKHRNLTDLSIAVGMGGSGAMLLAGGQPVGVFPLVGSLAFGDIYRKERAWSKLTPEQKKEFIKKRMEKVV